MSEVTERATLKISTHILIWIIGVCFLAGGAYVTFATKSEVEARDLATAAVAHQEYLQERAERTSDMKELREMHNQILQLLLTNQNKRK